MSLNVSCSFNKDFFVPGDIVSAYILAVVDGASVAELGSIVDSIVDIQCIGSLKIDYKWTRTTPGSVLSAIERPSSYLASSSTSSPSCHTVIDSKILSGSSILFTSSIISIPLNLLLEDGGIFFQFQLPATCAPSFRGISCSITYNIIFNFSKLGPTYTKDIAFPLTIISNYNEPTSHKLTQSLSYIISQSELSLDKYLFSSFEEEAPMITNSNTFQMINIQHTHPICTLAINHLSKGSIICYPGASISNIFNFESISNGHKCLMFKVTLIAVEKRPDGSTIQEKILFSSTRSARKAAILHTDVPISDTCAPSFTSFIVNLSYRLDYEFQVEVGEGSSTEAATETAVLTLEVIVKPMDALYRTQPAPHREAKRSLESNSSAWSNSLALML